MYFLPHSMPEEELRYRRIGYWEFCSELADLPGCILVRAFKNMSEDFISKLFWRSPLLIYPLIISSDFSDNSILEAFPGES